jgi:predicted amidohydrolase
MSCEILIKNGRIIDPANDIDKKCDVLIVDEKIAEVGKVEKPVQTVIDAGLISTFTFVSRVTKRKKR